MAIFLNDTEKDILGREIGKQDSLISIFYAALQKRVNRRVAWGNLLGPDATTIWWHSAAEYLSDAAMCYAINSSPELADWLHAITLDIVRKPAYEWIGPPFRDHLEPLTGHLETAHICWGISAVYDLAKNVFSEIEQTEIRDALREKGIGLCRQWIETNNHLANWRSIMVSGALVSAVVLEDEKTVAALLPELKLCHNAMQDDGSYGESLQYGNYLLLALSFAKEAVFRKYPSIAQDVLPSFDSSAAWFVTSMFYTKPLTGWGDEPRARAANFNDSAATFRPSGDLLLHMAVRGHSESAKGLSKWLFEKYYTIVPEQGPHDLATLGMRNDWGFLTLPLLTYPSKTISPEEADLPLTTNFSNGSAFIRDAWHGKTIIATNGGSEPLNGLGHLHGDLNSFILVHNNERLLADPGHSCYRNLIHGLESSSQTHNTCTFLIEKESLGLQEDLAKATLLEQKSVFPRRIIVNGKGGEKIERGDKRLICEKNDVISVIGSEVGKAYGQPIQEFSRFWILAGSNVLFVIDSITAGYPVNTVWNWVVNNRDGKAIWHKENNCLTVQKNNAGIKLFHGGNGSFSFPVYGFLHDAYHPEPNQLGEGRSGDGYVFRFTEKEKSASRTVVHAIALDEPDLLINWNLEVNRNNYTLKSDTKSWTLKINDDDSFSLISGHGRTWNLKRNEEKYGLERID
ncbi:heparinase II/III-family protein [Dyadobacter sp. CY345]|uniref:heparinase II/III domain-containing protein n=1 Tax=Dyadobacter sp. CY345 TaxID=2909335 RepID=UPI001F203599|nr:heparinase II/III family protein [Dyadobacter sp. CY345]MCF2446758.1 heparinase II/III-family protein [Dyadobacter sp. CY345]